MEFRAVNMVFVANWLFGNLLIDTIQMWLHTAFAIFLLLYKKESNHANILKMYVCMTIVDDYSVVLNKRAARLLIFEKFSYLHALIRYLHVY